METQKEDAMISPKKQSGGVKLNFNNCTRNILFYISALFTGAMLLSIIENKDKILLLVILLFVVFPFDFNSISAIKKCGTVYIGLFSVILAAWMTSDFRNAVLSSGTCIWLASSLHISMDLLSVMLSIIGFVAGVLFFTSIICFAIDKLDLRVELRKIRDEICEYRHLIRTFIMLLGTYLLAISTIILANVEYVDDMGRKSSGYMGWGTFSRYLSNILSQVIQTDSYMADISPLPQLIAVVEIAVASLIILIVFSDKKEFSIWNVIAVLPLGISPYFLECFSYKYDSSFMALSVLASVFPLLFIMKSRKLYLTATVLGILVTCNTYQAALGIFPIAIIIFVFMQWKNGEKANEIVRLILWSVVGYLSGVLIWRIFLMIPVDDYVSSEIYPLNELPMGIISNLKHYIGNVYADFDVKWLLFIGIILCAFVIMSTITSKRKKLPTAILSISTVILSICLSFGIYIAMVSPIFSCRSMYGFGACIAIFAVICTNFDLSTIAQISKVSCLGLSYCLLAFCFVYGNALEEQQRYVEFRVETVLNAMDDLDLLESEEPVNLQVEGTVGFSPIVENMPQYQNTALNRLVQTTFAGDDWEWDIHYFLRYYDLTNYVQVTDLEKEEMDVLYDGYYETIYGDETGVVIELKEY